MKEAFDYAAKTAELEEILSGLQQPGVAIDEAIRLHEKGQSLVKELEQFLQQAENEVKKHLVKD